MTKVRKRRKREKEKEENVKCKEGMGRAFLQLYNHAKIAAAML